MMESNIKCKNCKKPLKDCIELIQPATVRFRIKTNRISFNTSFIPMRYRKVQDALGYECSYCYTEYPKNMNGKIKNYLKRRRLFHQLMK